MKAKINVKSCPFCGNTAVKVYQGLNNIIFFLCENKECGALTSFGGSKQVSNGTMEAEHPLENWNRRAEND